MVDRVSAAPLRRLWRAVAGKLGRSQQPRQPSYYWGTVQALLSQGRCIFCSGEREATQRYFRWFNAENYGQPQVLGRLVRSRGFCTQHTRLFLAWSSPSKVVSVYSYIY